MTGRNEQAVNDRTERLARLWKERRVRYIRERAPLWRYVLSSGGLAMGFAVILLIQGYASLLARAREAGAVDEGIVAGGAALAALALLWNPARTYLQPPDLVYLLPYESDAAGYFRRAWRYGAVLSGAGLAAAYLLYLPFYRLTGHAAAPALLAALALLKFLLYYGAWKERQFRSHAVRGWMIGIKAAAVYATVYSLFGYPLGLLHLGLPVLWGAYAAALRIPESHRVNWQHLLQLDRRTGSLHDAWFRFFTDLPQQAETYRRRAYLDGVLRRMRYDRRNASMYLYWRNFLRSPAAVMVARMIALAAVLIWIFPDPWTAVPVYAVFAWLIGMQLRGLPSAAGNPLLDAVSPLAESERVDARRKIRLAVYGASVLLLAVPLFVWVPPGLAALCAVAGCASSIFFAGGRSRPA